MALLGLFTNFLSFFFDEPSFHSKDTHTHTQYTRNMRWTGMHRVQRVRQKKDDDRESLLCTQSLL